MENNFENEIKTLGIDIENAALEDAPSEGIDISNIEGELAIEPPKKKRKPVGGIIAGIFNIQFAIPAVIFCVAALVSLGFGIYFIYDLLYGTHEGLEAIGPFIMAIYTLPWIIGFVPAYFVLTIPSIVISIIYFIVARFNRSKFFKVSTTVIFIMHAIGWALVILAIISYAIFWMIAKFG